MRRVERGVRRHTVFSMQETHTVHLITHERAQRSLHSSGFTFYHSTIAGLNPPDAHRVLGPAARSYGLRLNG